MQEIIEVTGMVLKEEPQGEYDRRVVLLTTTHGKVTAFARGARRQGSRLMAATNPFAFGQFKLYPGRTAYSMSDAVVSNYFENLRTDFEGACFGMYFLEVMDYYTRENNDEKEMLRLLYQSIRALGNERLKNDFIKAVFEIKALVVEGEFPGIPDIGSKSYDQSTIYSVDYIVNSTIEKLFSFEVSDTVLAELKAIGNTLIERYTDRKFKSLEILATLL